MGWSRCIEVFRCPRCGAEALDRDETGFRCTCSARYPFRHGVLRMLEDGEPLRTFSQDAMRFRPLIRVYDLFWRRFTFPAVTFIPFSREVATVLGFHRLGPAAQVLDLACGPGTYTRRFAAAAGESGLVLGVDASLPMLEQAASVPRAQGSAATAYVHAAADTPLCRDGRFDGVNCTGALHLFDRPEAVLARVFAALRPGGTFSCMTFCSTGLAPLDAAFRKAGVNLFRPAALEEKLDKLGFVDYRARRSRSMLLFAASKPA